MRNTIVLFAMISFLSSGCATVGKSIALSAGSGAATGAAIGAGVADRSRGKGALIGAAVGGVVSGIAGYFIHKGLETRDEKVRKETLFNLEQFGVSTPANSGNGPAISYPAVEEHYIDTHVQGKKLIQGHKVWVITEDPQWIVNENREKK